ncbi:MAG: glycosyltransferase family 2 protein [Bacteroidaceae bacterium]|nr:glycosyltransferase family 2 protein [Bacteroidaceae bacterium]
MTKGLIGVIVPVYKVEKYIAECIESILAQTYTKFLLILVDDGTPDGAGKICDEYAKKDPRITVIHQQNAGVTRARARGVEEADDCEFITFVDSDDTLPKSALQTLHQAMKSDIEFVFTDTVLDFFPRIETDRLPAVKFQELMFKEKVASAPWGKLFRRELFDHSTFDIPREIVMGEDMIMNMRLSGKCKNDLAVIHTSVYNYNMHPENISRNFKDTAQHEYLFYSCIEDFMEAQNKCIIERLLKKWEGNYGYSHKRPRWYGTEIHKILLRDIEKYNYPIGKLEYSLLTTTNPLKRLVLSVIRKQRKKRHARKQLQN